MFLNCHSFFSLNYGVMSPEKLLKYASTIDVMQMALTDINNTSGCIDFMRLAKEYNIRPAIGIDFRHNTKQLYIALAKNNEGFRELNEFLSLYRMKHEEVPLHPPQFSNCTIIYPWKKDISIVLKEYEFIGLRPADIFSFRLYEKNIPREKLVVLASASFRNKK